jgi:hypothetical protein
MAKAASTKEVELHSDAWARFERAAGVVAKSPPQHRVAKKKAKKAAQKKRSELHPVLLTPA